MAESYKCPDPKPKKCCPSLIEICEERKCKFPFKIECVIVCDKYHDFLTHCLPTNKFIFDQLVVVTTPEDSRTQRVCEFYHVKCIRTDALRSRWKEFHKGKAINEGLAALKKDAWVVHMDSDVLMPPLTRGILQQADLDPALIYGIDRFDVRGYDQLEKFKALPLLQHEDNAYIHLDAFPMGTRVMHDHANGYVPIGFFQMWCPEVSGVKDYPAEHSSAGRGDTVHAQRWPRKLRGFIPELIGYHLMSDDAANASNWNGRTTAQFGPDPFSRKR